jgi:hypothetical protein
MVRFISVVVAVIVASAAPAQARVRATRLSVGDRP